MIPCDEKLEGADCQSKLQSGDSKTFCCRDCGNKVTYENMAGYTINYKMDKEGNRATEANMEMICMQCFYKA